MRAQPHHLYYLSHSTMVLQPVPFTFDSPGNGLIQKEYKGIKIKEEDEKDVTTNLGVELEERFDPDEKRDSDFNDAIDGNEDIADENFQLFLLFLMYLLLYICVPLILGSLRC